MEAMLVMFKNDGSRREFALSKPRLVIGRNNTCDLRIPLSSISREHCEIKVEGDRITLHDMGSSNGTFVNDSRQQEATLKVGDRLSVGPVTFYLVIDGQPSSLPGESDDTAVPATLEPDDAPRHADDTGAPAPAAKDAHRPGKPAQPVEGVAVPDVHENEPLVIPEELDSPTTDIDDPISALEALARATQRPGDQKKTK